MSEENKRTERGLVRLGDVPEEFPSRPSLPRASLLEWAEEESSTRTTEATVALPAPPQSRQHTRALLTIVGGPTTGRVHPLRDEETVIGRGKDCQVRIDDAGASRAHARIVLTQRAGTCSRT